jgi:hypothetical protein
MLKAREQMWLRLRLDLPPSGFNKKWLPDRWLASSQDYEQEFKSPGKVVHDIRTALNQFDPDKESLNRTIDPHIANVKNNALGLLPETNTPAEVKDWRAFLFHEFGLERVAIDTPATQATLLTISKQYTLPAHSVPPTAKRSSIPRRIEKLLPWLRDKGRICQATECFFGTRYKEPYCNDRDDNYSITTRNRSVNPIYSYLTWINLFIGLGALYLAYLALR